MVNSENIVTAKGLDDFTNTLMWMSARYWLSADEKTELEPDYPHKMCARYWSQMSNFQRHRLTIDVNREREYDWGNIERCDRLLGEYKSSKCNVFVPFLKCDDFEFTMIRMAILYACGRRTIASGSLPHEIIKYRYKFLSAEQKAIIVEDLTGYLDRVEKLGGRVFGDRFIDDKTWQKFMAALDVNRHFVVIAQTPNSDKPSEKITCFRCLVTNERWNEGLTERIVVNEEVVYPLDMYLDINTEYCEIFIPTENIINEINIC